MNFLKKSAIYWQGFITPLAIMSFYKLSEHFDAIFGSKWLSYLLWLFSLIFVATTIINGVAEFMKYLERHWDDEK